MPMARTNKQGIAKKKAVQQKQSNRTKGMKRFDYPRRKLTLEEAKDLGVVGIWTNPRGSDYHRCMRGRKICWETRLRLDPDGYRYIRTPSGGTEMVVAPISGWTRVKMRKNMFMSK